MEAKINNNICPQCGEGLQRHMSFGKTDYKICKSCTFMESNIGRVSEYMPGCIRTYTGLYVNLLNPAPEQFSIDDIAHALSHQPRFAGHLDKHYSVAQHSVLTALLVPQELKLAALLHDASEAYLCDVPAPIKGSLPDYKRIEDRVMAAIAERFGFQWPLRKEVMAADAWMLHAEWNDLHLGRGFYISPPSGEEYSVRWVPAQAVAAKRMFLSAFLEIKSGGKNG